jgi:hypothetical protein
MGKKEDLKKMKIEMVKKKDPKLLLEKQVMYLTKLCKSPRLL